MATEPVNYYEPLDSKKNEIRLLRLKSCQYNYDKEIDERRIISFLEHRTLEDIIEYTALSYVWENGLVPQDISVSGHERSVSANLVDALQRLRQDSDDVIVWADQLCINQDDSVEKASQIHIMRSIYERASRVIAWLGHSADDSDLVFTTLSYIARDYNSSTTRNFLPDLRQVVQEASSCHDQIFDSTRVLQNLRAALSAFAARRYWTRLWVLQEFAVATTLHIMCGSRSIPYDTLENAWECLMQAGNNPNMIAGRRNVFTPDIVAVATAWRSDPMWWDALLAVNRFISKRLYQQYHIGRQSPHLMRDRRLFMVMYTTLTTFSGEIRMSCSDSRDRLFSLLSLASDAQEFSHFPDYTRSTENTYEELARNFIQKGDVDVFSFCQENPSNRALKMASWAPDWSLSIRIPLWGKLHTDASKGWNVDLSAAGLDGGTIRVFGTCIGTIRSHGCRWSHDQQLTLLQTQTFLNQVSGFCNQSDLIAADDKESTCAQLAVPTASVYLHNKEIIWKDYQAVLAKLEALAVSSNEAMADLDSLPLSWYEGELRRQLFRCPFITDNGHVGIALPYIQEGDYICIFPGGHIPYILRPQLESHTFSLVGGAYVHGVMNGEYFKVDCEVRSFVLV